MKNEARLRTFQLVHKDKAISPVLVTTRSYGEWFSNYFDEYAVQDELWIVTSDVYGNKGKEWHPGTKIGNWFKNHSFDDNSLRCWYIAQHAKALARLKKFQLAELADVVQYEDGRMLKVYTLRQILLYLRTKYPGVTINMDYIASDPIIIKVDDNDLRNIIMPKIISTKNKLF